MKIHSIKPTRGFIYYHRHKKTCKERRKFFYYKDTEKWIEYNRKYRLKNREKINKYFRDYYKQALPRLKNAARTKLKRAVQKGIIIKKPCMNCGIKKVEGHHPNYNFPLRVVWVCKKHHWEIHNPTRRLVPRTRPKEKLR